MHPATIFRTLAESSPAPWLSPPAGEFNSSAGSHPEPVAPKNTTPDYEGGTLLRHAQRSWVGITATVSDVRCDRRLSVDLGSHRAVLSAALEEVGSRLDIRGKNGPSEIAAKPGPLSLIPAGFQACGQATGIRFIRHLVLELDAPILFGMLDDHTEYSDVLTPRLMFSDAGALHLAHLFADECLGGEPHSRLYGDSLSVALVLALSRLSTIKGQPIRRGQLAPWQLRRTTDYFLAHLADDIELQAVSDLVNLSKSYFSQAFKTSTGLSPYQWVLQARIGKAKELLLEAELPLVRIAVTVGFADQAHFTRTFVRTTGQSPRAWQRARRSLNGHCPDELRSSASAEAKETSQ